MKVLITSGGTKVKIDMVRSITNMSQGTFGTKIAEAFEKELKPRNSENSIKFLMALDSRYPKNPFVTKVIYITFEDYEHELFRILQDWNPDIVVLAAAVSDYGVENYVDGKIRSSENLVIRLKPLPKLISKVRDYVPDAVICGFKLLVNSSASELKRACVRSLVDNRLDLVVGNDLRDIKNDNHKLTIFGNFHGEPVAFRYYDDKKDNLAEVVANRCLNIYEYNQKIKNIKVKNPWYLDTMEEPEFISLKELIDCNNRVKCICKSKKCEGHCDGSCGCLRCLNEKTIREIK